MRIFLALILLATPVSVSLAQLPADITAGMRVRVTTSNTSGTSTQTGSILQVRGDSIIIRELGDSPIVTLSSRDITALDVSGGKPFSTWSGFKYGAILGGILGGIIGYKHYDVSECDPPTTACRNDDIEVAGVKGVAIGGALGAIASLIRGERWTPVIVPRRVVGASDTPSPRRADIRRALQALEAGH